MINLSIENVCNKIYIVEANKHKNGNLYIHCVYIVHPRQKEMHKISEHAKHFIHTKWGGYLEID